MGNNKNRRKEEKEIPGATKNHLKDTLKGSWFDQHEEDSDEGSSLENSSPEISQESIQSASFRKLGTSLEDSTRRLPLQ